MMYRITRVPVLINGKEAIVNVERHTREGSKSVALDIVIHNGKRFVPIQYKKWLDWTYQGLLMLMYAPVAMKECVFETNPLLKLAPPHYEPWYGRYIPIPNYER